MNAAAYSVAVAEETTVLMITLRKHIGALGISLSPQSPKNNIPPALERASDSLRYDPSLWQTSFMLLARIRIVASGHLFAYCKKRSISCLMRDVGFDCLDAILLIAVSIVGSTALE